jgi:hypothetical protein
VKRSSTAALTLVAARRTPPPEPGLDALRRRAGATAREAVLTDLLEDDLREAQDALADVAAWLQAASRSLTDPRCGRLDLVALAHADGAQDRLAYLETTLGWVRRRAGQLAARWPRGPSGR